MFDFLISAGILLFLLFAGVDYFLLMSQHKVSEHIMHYYLERVRVEGFLTTADENEMVAKFGSVGMAVESINCPRQSQGAARVLRNPQDANSSRIDMVITLKPPSRPLTSGFIIGASAAPDAFRIRVGGSVLSERVSP